MQFTPQRLDRVHRSMKKEEVDALIITRRQDVQYLTGYHTRASNVPVGCIIIEGSQPQLIISDAQSEELSNESIMGRIRSFPLTMSEDWVRAHGSAFWDEIAAALREAGLDKEMMGIQHEWLSVRGFEKLKSILPEAGFKDFSQSLWRLRHVKDSAEVDIIRQAVSIAEIGIRTALETVAAGKTEEEASLQIESAMRGAGGQRRGIRAAVLAGGHARFPYAQPGPQRIGVDSLVTLDITVSFFGYFAEVARTIHLGQPTEQQRKLFNFVLDARQRILKNLKPETKIEDLVNKVPRRIGRQFPPETLLQPFGSSTGLDLREPPYLSEESQYTIREGMVFSIHPLAYTEETGVVSVADVVLVDEDGPEVLGSLSVETL